MLKDERMNTRLARSLCLLAFFLCLALSNACNAATAAKPDTIGPKVDALVQAEMTKSHVPGLVLAIVKNGKMIKSATYGFANIDSKTPVTMDSAFVLASLSKSFVATGIMMLVEQGKLHLDDPISKYLDGTPDTWKKITIRNLLNHTSGIPDFLNENIVVDNKPDGLDQRLLDALAKRPLHFAPGDNWSYSNSNYHLLGMIIHKVTGKTYGDFLRERVFTPLGMTHTCVYPTDGTVPHLAVGYNWNKDKLEPQGPVAPTLRAFSGGGLISTVPDLIKWDAALSTAKLLKRSTLQQMWTQARTNDGEAHHYGLGWITDSYYGHHVVDHSGNFIGYSSVVYRCPDDHLSVIFLDNQFGLVSESLAKRIAVLYGLPDYHPIADKDPEITARVRDVLDRTAKGTLQAADFTPALWTKSLPDAAADAECSEGLWSAAVRYPCRTDQS